MKYNFRKILSALTSVAMISSTVGLAAAANYPAPFVENGAANVAVVYGSSATLDLAAVTDITTSLNDKITAQATGSSSSNESTTCPTGNTGNCYKIDKENEKLNLGDSLTTVKSSITNDELTTLLADGTYKNDQNSEFDYTQRITLGALQLKYFSDSNLDSNQVPVMGFNMNTGTFVMNYTLSFKTDAESTVDSNGKLSDIKTTILPLLGRNYYVSDAVNATTTAASSAKLTLLDTANTATVNEGESTTVVVGSKTYEVAPEWIKTNKVKLKINGVLTNDLAEGDSYNLGDGSYVGVKSIFQRDVAGVTGNVEFSIGSGKLEINSAANSVKLNDKSIPQLNGYITKGSPSGGKESIQKIVITWTTDDRTFLTSGKELVMPGFGSVKLSMGNFVMPQSETTKVELNGDRVFRLSAPLESGTVSMNILATNASGEFNRIGDDNTGSGKLYTSSTKEIVLNLSAGNEFVATYNTSTEAKSYLLKVTGVVMNTSSTDNSQATIEDEASSASQDVSLSATTTDTAAFGSDVELNVNFIRKSGADKFVNITAGNANVNFNTLFTKDGLKIYLPVDAGLGGATTAKGSIDFNNTATAGHNVNSFLLFFDEEDKDGNLGDGTSFNVTLDDDSNGKVIVGDIDTGQTEYKMSSSSDDYTSRVYSELATEVKYIKSSNDRRAVDVIYNGKQSYGEVYVSAPSTVIGGSTGGVISLKDSEVAQASGKNLIVVGGSCVNTIAAELLGGALCGADFTAKTKVGAGEFLIQSFAREGKIATLVAGYNAGDTANAAKALTTQVVDTTAGMAYKGSSATSITSVIA